jgi:hypothetical protein
LTLQLAHTLEATALTNAGCDRNEVDLNRLGQVTHRAPWFLGVILEELKRLLEHHGRVQVLIIHGWNVGQPKCDLGVGGTEGANGLLPVADAMVSVDERYWRTRVATFRAACAAAGITTLVGERYPAAHRSNLLQAFTPRFADAPEPSLAQLAAWSRARRLDALQLELGIPVRWPGSLRAGVVAAAQTAFGSKEPPAPAWRPPVRSFPPTRGLLGFHFHDPRTGLTAFTSVGTMGAFTGGRLLLFLGGQEIALFTGEESGAHGAVEGLSFTPFGDGFDLRFDGYATKLADAGLYLDLEAALAASTLCEITLALHFDSAYAPQAHQPCAGRFSGSIRVDGRHVPIDAYGFCDPGIALRGPGHHADRTHLAATFGPTRAFSLRAAHGAARLAGVVLHNDLLHRDPAGEIALTTDGDVYTPAHFRLQWGNGPNVAVHPLARMPIMRPLGDGAHARITFGPARFEWDGSIGWGVYEYARRVEVARSG